MLNACIAYVKVSFYQFCKNGPAFSLLGSLFLATLPVYIDTISEQGNQSAEATAALLGS